MELLSLNAGQVFDRERIYETVWGLDGEGNSDTVMEHIRKIRAKLAACTLHSYIDTVWGVWLSVERLKNMELKENFSRPICFLCFGGSPDVRLSLYDMQFNQQQLSLRWNRNFSRRFNR